MRAVTAAEVKIITGQRPDLADEIVYKYWRNAKDNKGWQGPDPTRFSSMPPQLLSPSCAHRFPQTGEGHCPECPQGVAVPLFGCDLHGACHVETNEKRNVIDAQGQRVRGCANCGDQQQPAEATDHLIAEISGPAKPRSNTWHQSPEVEEAHRQLLDWFCDSIPEYPSGFEGRGIVTCAGGSIYFTCAFVMISILRETGCTLPVEVWHLGWREMDQHMRGLLESLGNVTVIDAHEIEHALPEAERPRALGGWESKAFAIRHSRFREVLFVDADQVPVKDPEYLFDSEAYREAGSILWPDLCNQWGYDVTAQAFRTARLPVPPGSQAVTKRPTGYRPAETGQILIDKERAWPALMVCSHICDHSDYWWSGKDWLVYGDKSAFLLAWERTGQPYFMPRNCRWTGSREGGAFLQYDPDGKLIFQHRCQPTTKYNLHGEQTHPAGFIHANLIDRFLGELRSKWVGQPYDVRHPRKEDAGTIGQAAGEYCLFAGRQFSERIILSPEGNVNGFGRDDLHWTIERDNLVFSTWKKAEFLFGRDYGNGFGWCNHETDQHLLPVAGGFEFRPDDLPMWGDVGIRNDYALPVTFTPAAIVVDVGAHVGFFSGLALARGAEKVIAFEPDPANFELLKKNTANWRERREIHNAAAWTEQTTLRFGRPPAANHPGGGSVIDPARNAFCSVRAIDFDETVRNSIGHHPIAILKLDCEGSEFPLIAESDVIGSGQAFRITGEIHEGAAVGSQWSLDGLLSRLEGIGYQVTRKRLDEGLWLFNAVLG